MREIEKVKAIVEKYFKVEDVIWTETRLRFVCRMDYWKGDSLDIQFTKLRKELMPQGYVPRILKNETPYQDLSTILEEVATTPHLKEIFNKIKKEDQPEVREAWLEEFFRLATCPKCSSKLYFDGRRVECPHCGYGRKEIDKEEYIIEVVKKPKISQKGVEWNIALFILTVLSTVITGSLLCAARANEELSSPFEPVIFTPYYLARGALFFALPLMLIIGTHEMGHYFMSKRHGIAASLPFFIPLPPGVSPFGTMGAFISIREPISDKKALFDIGIAGPIAGLLVAIPITAIGIFLTSPSSTPPTAGHGPNIAIGVPYLYRWLSQIVPHEGGTIHPTAFAGWVGLFITALNLLPAGQLDGGHVARAILGEKAHYLSYLTLLAMVIMGFVFYEGWFLFAILIFFLGARHPPPLNDLSKLDKKRIFVGLCAVGILLTSFTPIPMEPLKYDVKVEVIGDSVGYVNASSEKENFIIYILNITNPGEVDNTYDITNSTPPTGWNVSIEPNNVTVEEWNKKTKPYKHVYINVSLVNTFEFEPICILNVTVKSQNKSSDKWGNSYTPKKTITFKTYAINLHRLEILPKEPITKEFDANNTSQDYKFKIENRGNFTENLSFSFAIIYNEGELNWSIQLLVEGKNYTKGRILSLEKGSSINLTVRVILKSTNVTQNSTLKIEVIFFHVSEKPEKWYRELTAIYYSKRGAA